MNHEILHQRTTVQPIDQPRGLLDGGVVRLVDRSDVLNPMPRLPDPDDELERSLAATNARSFERAAAALLQLFPHLPLAQFAQTTDATTLVVGSSSPSLMSLLDVESFVESMFQRFHFAPPQQIRFVRDKVPRDLADISVQMGHNFPGGRSRLRPAVLAAALEEGYTMVLDGVELRHAPSTGLAELFERVFACSVNINGYMSARRETSFGSHWDDQEVVILQLIGDKEWRIEEPTALSPLKSSNGDSTSGAVAWEGLLHPGDTIYVPRGWGHLVRGLDELTYHYTITIPRVHGVTVMDGLLTMLSDTQRGPLAASPLPIVRSAFPATEVLSYLSDSQLEQALHRVLGSIRFAIPRRATQGIRSAMSSIDSALSIRSPCPGGWVIFESRHDEMVLGMANVIIALPRSLVPSLASFTDGTWQPSEGIDPDLVRGLLAAGLLEARDDSQ